MKKQYGIQVARGADFYSVAAKNKRDRERKTNDASFNKCV